MKISFNWLRELVDLPAETTADLVASRLTMAGLEVEAIERRGREVTGVRVAEVRGIRPHPNAEKLRIVRLHAGGAEEDVVCGAPNVPATGGRVCWAGPGATLPGGRTLDRREIRGFASPGMICSEVELGMSDEGDGILILSPDAPVGADVAAHLGLGDDVLEVNVTPNRADALSHAGIARELSALFGVAWHLPRPDEVPVIDHPVLDVQLRDTLACPRYLARIVTDLRVMESPPAVRVRLAACGMRAISNVVDATNYVLLEIGHPLHAFDLDKLSGGIFVRRAAARERMTTLDAVDRALEGDDIVIADAKGPVALAGVMGGATSEVSATTTRVFLEAATFEPRSIRRTAKRLSLHSEASHRFERGVDPNGVPHAAARAAALIARLGGGAVSSQVVDRYPQPATPRKVMLSMARLRRLAGYDISAEEATRRLRSIEIPSTEEAGVIHATVPTFRPDVVIEEDLCEEVMRLHGYDRAPARLPSTARAPLPSPEAPADRARAALCALGLHEVVTWAFVPRTWLSAIGGELRDVPASQGIAVKNPISTDYEVMRTSLLPGLADAARRNLSRGVDDPWLFEVGPVVRRAARADDAPDEPLHTAALLCGHREGWLKPGPELDFFDAKQVVSELLAALSAGQTEWTRGALGMFLHPGVSADVRVGGARVGCVGQLDPRVQRTLDLQGPAFYFEVDLTAVAGAGAPVRSAPLPRFPAVTRDVSFWVDCEIAAADQRAALGSAGEPLLHDLRVLEDFRDPKFAPPGKKGMLWTLTYRAADRTLTDAEADAAHARVVAALSSKCAITIR